MTCDDIKQLLSELADGEISPADRAKVEVHLASCADCRTELDALKRVMDMVKDIPRETLPESFTADVVARIKRGQLQPVGRSVTKWLGIGGWVAAAAAILVVLNIAIKTDSPSSFEKVARESIAPQKKIQVAKADSIDMAKSVEAKEKGNVQPQVLKEAGKMLAKREALAEETENKLDEVADAKGANLGGAPAPAPAMAPPPAASADAELAQAAPQVDMTMELAVADLKSGEAQIREVASQMQGRIIEAEGGKLVVEVPESQMENFGAQLAKASNIAVQNSVYAQNYGGFKNQQAQQMQEKAAQVQRQMNAGRAEVFEAERDKEKGLQEMNNALSQPSQAAIERGQAFRNRQQMNQLTQRPDVSLDKLKDAESRKAFASPARGASPAMEAAPAAPQKAAKAAEKMAEPATAMPADKKQAQPSKLEAAKARLVAAQKKLAQANTPEQKAEAKRELDAASRDFEQEQITLQTNQLQQNRYIYIELNVESQK